MPENPENDKLDLALVQDARRLLVLGGIRTGNINRVIRILDDLIAKTDAADPGELVNREGGCMEKVVFHAVHIAAARFNPDEADPGFSADMHEDILRDACIDYVQAILARRAHGA